MKTLVYFASGRYKEEYQDLDFDKIYLIDHCFRSRNHQHSNISVKGKTTCIGMDCLQSIQLLKKEGVVIDCFVSLNEGLYEGGGSYAINSDMFLGYAMPLFREKYVHIMNKNYYQGHFHVSMDLPYSIQEITEVDNRYISPFIFSMEDYHKGHAKVFQMTKKDHHVQEFQLNDKIKLRIIHDSIWSFYEKLDACVVSFSQQGQGQFFNQIPKVVNFRNTDVEKLFAFCDEKQLNKIGFTPFGGGSYNWFIEKLEKYQKDYPKEVYLFHLNKDDYGEIKAYAKKY